MQAIEMYADIINLPGPVRSEVSLRRHPRMPLSQRAKIFMPFAALAGYEEAVRAKEVPYEPKRELDPEERDALNRRLQRLRQLSKDGPTARRNRVRVKVVYFQICTDRWNDAFGKDGLYETVEGLVNRVDTVRKVLVIDGTEIPFSDIYTLTILGSMSYAGPD